MKHFTKLLSCWSTKENRVVELFVDNYQSGESSESVTLSIEHPLVPYMEAGLKVTGGTFDQGGGGSGNVIHPQLVQRKVFVGDAIYNACFFHCWQKPFEWAVKESMGVGGLGRRTVIQLAVSCWHLMKCFSKDQFKKFWSEATHHGLEGILDNKWEEERDMFEDNFKKIMDAVQEGLTEGLSLYHAMMRALVTRWKYINLAVRHLFDNWVQWYWVARGIRNLTAKGKVDGRAGKISRGILSLMRQRPDEADILAAANVPFDYDDDFDLDGIDDETDVLTGCPPQLYIQACFIVCFSDECWEPFFNFINRTEQRCGEGSIPLWSCWHCVAYCKREDTAMQAVEKRQRL